MSHSAHQTRQRQTVQVATKLGEKTCLKIDLSCHPHHRARNSVEIKRSLVDIYDISETAATGRPPLTLWVSPSNIQKCAVFLSTRGMRYAQDVIFYCTSFRSALCLRANRG